MFTRKRKVQMCRARYLAASLSGLCSVPMRETLHARVDLTDAVVDMVKHISVFDGTSLPSGTYVYRLEAAGQARTGLMTLMR